MSSKDPSKTRQKRSLTNEMLQTETQKEKNLKKTIKKGLILDCLFEEFGQYIFANQIKLL